MTRSPASTGKRASVHARQHEQSSLSAGQPGLVRIESRRPRVVACSKKGRWKRPDPQASLFLGGLKAESRNMVCTSGTSSLIITFHSHPPSVRHAVHHFLSIPARTAPDSKAVVKPMTPLLDGRIIALVTVAHESGTQASVAPLPTAHSFMASVNPAGFHTGTPLRILHRISGAENQC